MRTLILVAILLAAFPAFSEMYYDATTGNYYFINRKASSTNVHGQNLNNNSMWNSTYKNDGTAYGTNANGDVWMSDSKSGNYFNTDGTTCIGKGWARQCF